MGVQGELEQVGGKVENFFFKICYLSQTKHNPDWVSLSAHSTFTAYANSKLSKN
jgi:hypothetical protein